MQTSADFVWDSCFYSTGTQRWVVPRLASYHFNLKGWWKGPSPTIKVLHGIQCWPACEAAIIENSSIPRWLALQTEGGYGNHLDLFLSPSSCSAVTLDKFLHCRKLILCILRSKLHWLLDKLNSVCFDLLVPKASDIGKLLLRLIWKAIGKLLLLYY